MIGLCEVFKGVDGDISPIMSDLFQTNTLHSTPFTSNSPVTHQTPSYLLSLSPDPMQKKKNESDSFQRSKVRGYFEDKQC